MCRKCAAVDTFTFFVQRHQNHLFGSQRKYCRRFFTNALLSIAGAAFHNFMDIKAAKAELAPDILKAFTIAIGQFSLRTLLKTTNGNDDQSHWRTLTCDD